MMDFPDNFLGDGYCLRDAFYQAGYEINAPEWCSTDEAIRICHKHGLTIYATKNNSEIVALDETPIIVIYKTRPGRETGETFSHCEYMASPAQFASRSLAIVGIIVVPAKSNSKCRRDDGLSG